MKVSSTRIGVLGAARIVRTAQFAPEQHMDGIEISGIAVRVPQRAQAFAAKRGIPRTHSSYEAMLTDPEIDAVYFALPAALHAEWLISAVQAGKHVPCEKLFTSNAAAATRVASVAATSDRVVMEAYHTHYQPQHGRLREILVAGEIGKIRSARATFCIPVPPGRDIRWNPASGGGSLLDVGYYPVRAPEVHLHLSAGNISGLHSSRGRRRHGFRSSSTTTPDPRRPLQRGRHGTPPVISISKQGLTHCQRTDGSPTARSTAGRVAPPRTSCIKL
ncbi:Gfo/Idh/MocA family protein [Arthrobacter sp. Z1-15]